MHDVSPWVRIARHTLSAEHVHLPDSRGCALRWLSTVMCFIGLDYSEVHIIHFITSPQVLNLDNQRVPAITQSEAGHDDTQVEARNPTV